jgi:pimeloyl-ACP methyl ester carboxylesterase
MNIKKSSLEVNGINITLYEAFFIESKTPLFLLHGGGLDSAMLSYGSIMAALGGKFHVIVPDLPGYGDSDKPDAPYTIEWYQEFLDDLIKVLGFKQVNLGGLSLGGGIALGYSINNPEKIKNLVLIAPYGLTDKIPYPQITSWLLKHQHIYDLINNLVLSNKMLVKASLKRILVNPDSLTDDVIHQLMEIGSNPDSGRAWRSFQLSEIENKKLRTCFLDQLPNLKMPVLLLTGKKDSLVPIKDVERAHALIPQSKLVELDDCGHWLPRDRSSEFIHALDNFLK